MKMKMLYWRLCLRGMSCDGKWKYITLQIRMNSDVPIPYSVVLSNWMQKGIAPCMCWRQSIMRGAEKKNKKKTAQKGCEIRCDSIKSLHFDNGPLFSCGTKNNIEFDIHWKNIFSCFSCYHICWNFLMVDCPSL